jgi:protein-S-isoprenylcysteine O-methyltransferase Ste14
MCNDQTVNDLTVLIESRNEMKFKYISIIATLALILIVTRLGVTQQLLGQGPVTIGLQILAVLLMVWARFVFGLRSFHAAANTTTGKLVTTGPYKYMRNPIYSAALLFVWSGITSHASLITILLGCVATTAFLVRIFCEEQFLESAYPSYGAYRLRTRRLIPFIC